jgi:ABC-type transport system substrate-binding protein
MWRLITILLALLGTVLLTMTWSGAAAEKKADFTFINRGDNKTLDPNSMSWLQDIRIAYALWEGLYTLDSRTLEPIPGTADQIKLSDDQRVYTFHIRDAARWSNNDPVEADDFIFAWRRMLEQPAEYVELLFYIQGAKAYQEAYAAWSKAQPDDAPPTQGPPISPWSAWKGSAPGIYASRSAIRCRFSRRFVPFPLIFRSIAFPWFISPNMPTRIRAPAASYPTISDLPGPQT